MKGHLNFVVRIREDNIRLDKCVFEEYPVYQSKSRSSRIPRSSWNTIVSQIVGKY